MTTKENLLELIDEAIPEYVTTKPVIMQEVERLVPPDEMADSVRELIEDSSVRRSFALYRKFHPEEGNVQPTLAELLDWLRGRGGVNYALQLEYTIGEIQKILDHLGPVETDHSMPVPGRDIVMMRSLIERGLIGDKQE